MRVNQSGNSNVQSSEAAASKSTSKAAQAKKTGKAAEGQAQGKAQSADSAASSKAELSAKGREMSQAKAVASDAPDVREEKIAELKRRIQEKRYQVDSTKVADKMVDDHLKMSGMS